MAGFSHLLAHLDVRQLKSSLEHLLKSLSLSTEIASFTILLLTHHQRSIFDFDFHFHFLNCVPCHLKCMKDCTNINRLLDRPTEVHLHPTQSLGLKYVQICMKIRTFHSWYYFQHSLYNNMNSLKSLSQKVHGNNEYQPYSTFFQASSLPECMELN